MVIENPLSDEQQVALEEALDGFVRGSVEELNVSTYDGEFDYEVTFREVTNEPRMRDVTLGVVWHSDEGGWEIASSDASGWLS